MPQRVQTDPARVERILRLILARPYPPVARLRLLSSGLGPGHMLKIYEGDGAKSTIIGSKACLGCGCCMDACPVLARDSRRRLRSEARSSMALETLIAEDCDRCANCALACPQVDTTLKHYIIQTHFAEGMAALLEKAITEELLLADLIIG